MISLNIFLVLIGLTVLSMVYYILRDIKRFSLDSVVNSLFHKSSLLPLGLAIIVLIAACVVPSVLQNRDEYLIAFAKQNIELYNDQITEYTVAAQKQISEYQKMQSEMARTATPLQLQYFAQQADAVGNGLTNQIKTYNDEILKWKIEINRAQIRMQLRPKNKWVFGI